MKKSSGIALIQVLIIVAVLSIFVLYINSKTSSQIKIATLAQDRAQAITKNHSLTSNILFSILTNHTAQSPELLTDSELEQPVMLNFYNAPVQVENAMITIQDQAGLLNLNVFYKEPFKQVFMVNGVEEGRAELLWQMLIDWQDKDDEAILGNEKLLFEREPRNGFISDLMEVTFISVLSSNEEKVFFNNFSLYSVGEINLLAAPLDILKAGTRCGYCRSGVKFTK